MTGDATARAWSVLWGEATDKRPLTGEAAPWYLGEGHVAVVREHGDVAVRHTCSGKHSSLI